MNTKVYLNNLWQQFSKILVLGLCAVAFVSGWLVSGINNQAQAGIFDSNSTYQEDRVYEKVDSDILNKGQDLKADVKNAADKAQRKVESDLDRTQSAADKLQRKVARDLDRTQTAADKTANKLQRKVESDLDRTQDSANKATNSIQDAAEGAIDAVKDIFNK